MLSTNVPEPFKDLTTENLRKLFKNNFELAHFSIQMGRFCIRGGHSSLSEILDEVRKHPTEAQLQELERLEEETSSE